MGVMANKFSWSMYDVQDLILQHKNAESIWKVIEGDRPLHPVILDLIERGIALRSKDKKFREREIDFLKKSNPKEYARRVNIEAEYVSSSRAGEMTALNKLCANLKSMVDDYASSVLSKLIFGGKELGMMTRDDVNREYTLRRNRSEKEFKQSVFLEEVSNKMVGDKLVKDYLSPSDANYIWENIESSSVFLTDAFPNK